jgi:hypothetical protein
LSVLQWHRGAPVPYSSAQQINVQIPYEIAGVFWWAKRDRVEIVTDDVT